MPAQQTEPMLDAATVQRLSDGLRRCIETAEARDEVFAPDVFVDIYPPFWRFQLQGVDALTAQLRSTSGDGADVRVLRTVATASGFVTEHEESTRGDRVETARHLWLCEVRGGRITEAVGYCNGGWDDELRARQAAEAPMLRP
jgi:ketosteroid isomerase-like protein